MASLANFNFTIEYQRGRNNAAADALSRVNESLNAQEVKAILDETTVGCSDRAELSVLAGRRGEEEERVRVSVARVPKEEMHVIDWLAAQKGDPVIRGGYRVDAVGKGEIPQASSWHPSLHPGGVWDSLVSKNPSSWSTVSFT